VGGRHRRRGRPIATLKIEVGRRAEQTGRRFTIQDLDDIAEYLAHSHYKLAK
jgi:hypothetical protein